MTDQPRTRCAPCYNARPVTVPLSPPALLAMQPPSPRILIVDDLPDNILLIRQVLARAGLPACVGETDPRQAIARFHAEDFDLVLLDYNMPHLSGLEVLAAIGEQSRSRMIPVVMVTARDDRDTR